MTDILWRFSHLLHGHPKDFLCFLAKKKKKKKKKKNAKRVFLLKVAMGFCNCFIHYFQPKPMQNIFKLLIKL